MEERLIAGGGYPRPIRPDTIRIGWIGTGVMGAFMAGRILAAGYSIAVYARTPSKAAALTAAGARLASTPADAATGADVVFTMVGHPSDVRAAVLDSVSGVLTALPAGGVLVDNTSSHPALAQEIAAAALARGCWSIDAPVSGGDIGARDGKLAIFAGGEDVIIQWLTPLWEILGKATAMGGPGSGQSSKIANQITVGGSLLGLSEALVFARAAGLDAGEFLAAVRGGAAGSAAMEIWGDRVIEGDFRPGGFVEYMVKDLGMGLEDTDSGGSEERSTPAVLPGAALCRQLYQAMVANGDGKMGTQGLITVIQKINGRYSASKYLNCMYSASRYPTCRYSSSRYSTSRYLTYRYSASRYPYCRHLVSRYPSCKYSTLRYLICRYSNSRYSAYRYSTCRCSVSRYPSCRYSVSRYLAYRYSTSRYPFCRYSTSRYLSCKYPDSTYPSCRYSASRYLICSTWLQGIQLAINRLQDT